MSSVSTDFWGTAKLTLRLTKLERALFVLFLITLPLVNPWVRGDGVGYYAFARAALIEHNMDFRNDWERSNLSFRTGRVDSNGRVLPDQFTRTGHLNNHFSIGPAILWSPFLLAAHLGVKASHMIGSDVPADGFSLPYRLAMAFGTACYGFLGIWIAFRLARRHLSERWAFAGAISIWFGSPLVVYMYFNPSWSHAQSAFTVAVFLSYWDLTREQRSFRQWLVLGLVSALMINVYYVNIVLLMIPLLESLRQFWYQWRSRSWEGTFALLFGNLLFAVTVLVGFLPTLVAKKIVYGDYFNFGYTERWYWKSPAALDVAFSSDHGLFTWTPILGLAVLGLFFLSRYDRTLSFYLILAFTTFLYVIGSYESWDGVSSFGNRFFVSLTPIFVIGTAAFFNTLSNRLGDDRTVVLAYSTMTVVVLWNFGLIFQWGTHLMPARGPVSWRETVRNQFFEVPQRAGREVSAYLIGRRNLMEIIEQQDVQQLKSDSDRKHGGTAH
jgi:hypothetical protein